MIYRMLCVLVEPGLWLTDQQRWWPWAQLLALIYYLCLVVVLSIPFVLLINLTIGDW